MSSVPSVVQCGGLSDETNDATVSVESCENIKKKTRLSSELDKIGDIFSTVDWGNGPGRQCVHKASKLTLSNAIKLEQANTRKENT
jgi:hypothetical protein